ncbi:hypothetical protein [Acinetobacter baumannii]|uniref:hypothetical protein n=1 Tax=Acinetobacter baumannii TaxID=470 RepID=UPI002AF73583|nr:hypothetical protein [Acinetobacter baumannii]
MTLPILNTFSKPFQIWSKRELTPEEIEAGKYEIREMFDGINDKIEKSIDSALDAAKHIAEVVNDEMLASHIEKSINNESVFKIWRKAMPSKVPPNINNYQKLYPKCDFEAVSREIEEVGHLPTEGQYFFHGGYIFKEDLNELYTDKPLSTTLCPQVALLEAVNLGKAFHDGVIHLYVLKVVKPQTKVYVFKQNGSKMGREREILFAAGAKLKVENKTLINESFPTGISEDYREIKKDVPIYVIEVSIS